MSFEAVAVIVSVYVWAGWVIWNGRANSPRRRRERARMDYLIAEAKREKVEE